MATSPNPFVRYWMVEGNSGREHKVSQRANGNFACACERWKFSSCVCGHKKGQHNQPGDVCLVCGRPRCQGYHRADCHHIEFVKTELGIEKNVVIASVSSTPEQRKRTAARPMRELPNTSVVNPYAVPPELIAAPVLDRPIRKFRADLD